MPADIAGPGRPTFVLDIGPLGERHHTGIANVAKKLAAELLNDRDVDAVFFTKRQEVPRDVVARLVELDGGEILNWVTARAQFPRALDGRLDGTVIGLFPATKPHRRLFPTEVQVVHDLTTLVMPHFHHPDAVEVWQRSMFGDLASSDLLVAVSESTRTDVRTYFPQLGHIPCVVAPLAACTTAVEQRPAATVEPYVLVLGTIEPRKNVEFVIDALSRRLALLDAARFVFIGRWGWGQRTRELIERHGLQQAAADGRLRFTGFVSDAVRDALVAHARCVVYPSRYEGFGLPVLEALSFGTPVVTSFNSSLPEVGGTVAAYCDFSSADALADALAPHLDPPGDPGAADARRAWAANFRWADTYRTIRDAALAVAAGRTPDAPSRLG